ncbi:PREDICTED: guanine nucleotide-binding protein subunit beta-like protein 1 [Eufriesea mexicana]|uniref:guanine nucleotide-binding protein subunit beta-like protein 1 n=1 Tax=Eufriesea mexicana TaxID=516756 RepID=UPI00083BF516|nr:PREDICTED: guanine nucleotide-binding protein subunit beta-like protein 1 [Eufriesea mexicana]
MAILPPDPKYLFRGEMGCIHCILFQITSNIEHLYAGTAKGNVHIWDLNTNRELCRITSEQDSCLNLQSLNNNLFVQHKSGLIKVYKKTESQWTMHKFINIDFYHYCRFQVFSENEICLPLKESSVGILSTNNFNIELKLNSPDFKNLGEVMTIKPLKNEKLVLVGYEAGKLILWDIRQCRILNCLTIETCPMALDFDTTLLKGAVAGPTNNIQIFNLSVNHLLQNKNKITLINPGTSVITIRSDAKIMAVGGWDSRVRIFSWKSLKPLAVLNQHKDTVHDISYSTQRIKAYDNKFIMATAAKDGYIALWDIYN